MSPFKAIYGHEPRHWGITTTTSYTSKLCNHGWMSMQLSKTCCCNTCRVHVHEASDGQKILHHTFVVEDMAFMKLQPYIHTSIAKRANHKLSCRHYGPYQVIDKINDVAYHPQPPEQAFLHFLFHVSQNRCALLLDTITEPELPTSMDVPMVLATILQQC